MEAKHVQLMSPDALPPVLSALGLPSALSSAVVGTAASVELLRKRWDDIHATLDLPRPEAR